MLELIFSFSVIRLSEYIMHTVSIGFKNPVDGKRRLIRDELLSFNLKHTSTVGNIILFYFIGLNSIMYKSIVLFFI